jgi:hypothetical protein
MDKWIANFIIANLKVAAIKQIRIEEVKKGQDILDNYQKDVQRTFVR